MSAEASSPAPSSAGWVERLSAPGLLLAVLVAFWILRIATPGSEYPAKGDILHYFYASYVGNYSLLAEGRLPLWNPYQLCGIPTLATLQGGLLYPPHLLYLVLPTHAALALSALLHLCLLGVSLAAFARKAGLSAFASLLVGGLCTMRGLPIWAGHLDPAVLESAAWLGVGSLGVLYLLRGQLARGTAMLGLAVGASLLAGYPQVTIYMVYAWTALLGLLLAFELRAPLRWLPGVGGLLAGVGLGALVAGVVLLPGLELASEGARARETLPLNVMFPYGYLVRDLGLWQVIVGTLEERAEVAGSALPLAFGAAGLALIPVALLNRRKRPLAAAALVLGVLTLFFALGPVTPLFDLYLALPQLGMFREPRRVLFISDFAFAIAAGVGLDALLATGGRAAGGAGNRGWLERGWRRAPGIVCAGTCVLLALGLAGGSALVPLVLGGIAVCALLASSDRLPSSLRSGIAAAVFGLVVLELFASPASRWRYPYFEGGHTRAYHEERDLYGPIAASDQRLWVWRRAFDSRMPPKVATVFRMRSIEDLEILTLRRQEEYFNYLYNGTLTSRVDFQPFYGSHPMLLQGTDLAGIRRRDRLADLAAVRFVVIPVASMRSAEVRDYVEGAGYGLRARDGDLVLLENPRALPRAFVTYRVAPAPDVETLLAILSAEDFDPLAMSYVEGLAERSPDASAPKSGAAAHIVVDLDRVVEVDAKLDAPGFVVLADTFYPGWTAEVDGEPVEIHPTNHLFRGVEVPAGHHTVRFEYEPSSFRIGALASVTGVLMLAVVALRSRRG